MGGTEFACSHSAVVGLLQVLLVSQVQNTCNSIKGSKLSRTFLQYFLIDCVSSTKRCQAHMGLQATNKKQQRSHNVQLHKVKHQAFECIPITERKKMCYYVGYQLTKNLLNIIHVPNASCWSVFPIRGRVRTLSLERYG